MRRVGVLLGAVAVVAMCITIPTDSAEAKRAKVPKLRLHQVADVQNATAMAVRPGDPLLYVALQGGEVVAIRDGSSNPPTVLDITSMVESGGEQGLLGLVFSPDGATMYVHYSDVRGDTQVDAYTMNAGVAVPSTRRAILSVHQPQGNHNGGQLAFGPDGMLYLGLGDGGNANDEGPGHASGGNGQSLGTLLGKILRFDPRPTTGAPSLVPTDNPFAGREGAKAEIWAYGLRNPWRFSFDSKNGDLWIGDVGQDEWEEIDHARAVNGRDAGKGVNYGWNRLEGSHGFRGDAPAKAVEPVFEVSHDTGACSITGGYVYRGRAITALRGMYLFSDYCRGDIHVLRRGKSTPYGERDLGISARNTSSFGQDEDGELYVLSQSDGLFRIQRARS